MEIRQLEYFKAICSEESFTKAAQKLHITQPSITVSINKLEDEIGVKLFNRSNKGISLSEQGKVFYERVDEILNLIENTSIEMKEYKEIKKEVIRVGIPPIIGYYIYSKVFAQYKKENSNIELIITERGSAEVVRLLEEDELDMGIIILEHTSDLIDVKKIKKDEILVCFSHESELKKHRYVPFNILENEVFILAKDGTYIRRKILNECKKYGFNPNILFDGVQIITVIEMVSNGVGITFITDEMARKNSNIIARSLEVPIHIDVGLAKRKNKYFTRKKKEFWEFIMTL